MTLIPVYTVYQVTNTVNGKIYIGVHKTTNPADAYLGSGLAIREALTKYGRSAFIKEVLYSYPTLEEAYAKERELVNTEFVARKDTYNMICGGAVSIDWTERRRERTATIVARQIATRKANGKPSYWKGRSQSVESNLKRSAAHQKLEKLQCPKCEKMCDPGNAKQYHFDNCGVMATSGTHLQVACPHCGKVGQRAVMARWHMSNCKSLNHI